MQSRDMDDLTPLDARNSLLLGRPQSEGKISKAYSHKSAESLDREPVRPASPDRWVAAEEGYHPPMAPSGGPLFRPMTPTTERDVRASMGQGFQPRQPTLPNVWRPQYGVQQEQEQQPYQPSFGAGVYRGF